MTLQTNEDYTTLRSANLRLRKDGILEITFNDFVEVRYRDSLELLRAITQFLPEGGAVLFQYGLGVFITHEARIELTHTPLIRSAAFLAYTQTATMLANFLVRFSETSYPAAVFSSRKLAINWLHAAE